MLYSGIIKTHKNMKYLKVDYSNNFTSICDSKEEVMDCCGYDYEEIIEIIGNIEFLNS